LWHFDRPSVPMSTAVRLYIDLAEATAEVEPVSDDEEPTPDQVYAAANEPEYLWLAGRHDAAVNAIERRASDIPVENRERWAALAKRASRELGETHRITLRCKARHSTWIGKSGDAAEALARFQELLPIATGALFENDEEVLSIRNNIGHLLGELGQFDESKEEFATLVRDTEYHLGPHHRETLHARHLFAVATGKAGDGAESLRLARELLPEARDALGDDEIVSHIRHNIAFWSAEIEQPPPVVQEYQQLLAEARRRLNDRHPDTLDIRFGLALTRAKAGQVTEALAEWTLLLDDSVEVRGERHQETQKIREQLAHWSSRE
jgi:tetratricopeptide (TPR) repeat protein